MTLDISRGSEEPEGDAMHPEGKCRCAQEGTCEWCRLSCPGCGEKVGGLGDGEVVVFHPACGYCSHPTVIGGACTACKREP